MFAYCLNNPITFEDSTGSAAKVCFSHTSRVPDNPIRQGGGGGSTNYNRGMSSLPVSSSPIKKELTFWQMFANADAQVASDAQHFAFYYGVLIVKVPVMDNTAFSCGIIFMGPNSSANLVKHEFGHVIHMKQIGVGDYLSKVVLPSVTSFWLFPENRYYTSQPWEYIAEFFGNTEPPPNGYLNFADELASFYWLFTMIL